MDLLVNVTTQGVVVPMVSFALVEERAPVMAASAMWSRPQTCCTSMEMPMLASAHLLPTALTLAITL